MPNNNIYNYHKVIFRFRAPYKVQFAELHGDMIHWYHLIIMNKIDDNLFETQMYLPTGIYEYKYKLSDGKWFLDPDNPSTRSTNGNTNNLLIVGGAGEPIMHAPVNPYVYIEDDGRVCIKAGLRKSNGNQLILSFYDGVKSSEVLMKLTGEEDEYWLYKCYIPGSSKFYEYNFILEDRRVIGLNSTGAIQTFKINLDDLKKESPEWWKKSILYTIFVDRFKKSGFNWQKKNLSRDEFAGGDLQGIIESIPYLSDLGVNAVHLTPIFMSKSVHRYDCIDFRRISPELGGESVFCKLIEEAHKNGIKIILDIPVTHVNKDFFGFQDVYKKGPDSPYWNWFIIYRYPFVKGYDPGYAHYTKGQWKEPLLNTKNDEVADYLTGVFEHWTKLGVDGFRVDAAAEISIELIDRIKSTVKKINKDVILFGEVIPDNTYRWTAKSLDSATDFGIEQVIYKWFIKKRISAKKAKNKFAIRDFLRGTSGYSSISFTATHDQVRLLTLCKNTDIVKLAYLLIFVRPEIPSIYYGDELGIFSEEPSRNFEDSWPDRQCMPWDKLKDKTELLEFFKALINLRKRYSCLTEGDLQYPDATFGENQTNKKNVFIIRRTYKDEIVDIIIHGGEGNTQVLLPSDAPSDYKILLKSGDVIVNNDVVKLGSWSAVILERFPLKEKVNLWNELNKNNRILSGISFKEGNIETVSLPANLYLLLTEKCNLNCLHCITGAPGIRKKGTAREMQRWALNNLKESFAAADYFGFVHGEPLLSELLLDVLKSIQELHQKPDYNVHILTNGMLLSRDKFLQLVDYGVTSLGISLDGATKETNDLIRDGCNFNKVINNIEQAVKIRNIEKLNMRIGISVVVTDLNICELSQIGKLCCNLGVDWLKIEELFPATSFARHHMIMAQDLNLIENKKQLIDTIKDNNLVLVDHLSPPEGCDCDAKFNNELKKFRNNDNYANRAHFNPCRAMWEQAWIDPDGTVKPVDSHHSPIGNILHESMLSIWNNEEIKLMRSNVLKAIPLSKRSNCPLIY